ncbi:hypothetical protein ACFXKG_27785 [Streptomyces sp. NPDC059255]|uniref:hypothetical protein n=1 Tax=Streptomyces sp. NPDC059255 TaxID=3346793 RepID=UPI003680A9C9
MTARETAGRAAPTPAPTAYDRRMRALMNRGEARPFHATAARRRLVVATHIALTVSIAVTWGVAHATERSWLLFVAIGLLLPWCLATGVINSATRGLLELRGRVLDERQRAERDRVGARAHRTMLVLLLGGTLGFIGARVLGDTDVTVSLPYALAVALITHWLMPLWVAGLRVQDEPAED